MAQLKVKQISDFVAAVGTIHNGVVGTGTATAIATAKSEAISAAGTDATTKANAAEAEAIRVAALDATSKANAAEAEAIRVAALDATSKADGALSDAKDYSDIQKLRIDALLLNSTEALDTFTEIENFIKGLDTADIVGLVNDISTAKSEAIAESTRLGNLAYDKLGDAGIAESNANGYTDDAINALGTAAYNATGDFATAAQGLLADSALQDASAFDASGSASAAQTAAISSAKSYTDGREVQIKLYADAAESDAVASAKTYTDTEIASVQSQISDLAGVNSDEVIATFVDVRSFDAGKVFNLNGGHVAVFVNGLQIHEAAEGVDGWSSENGQLFTVAGLGYELEADDHIVVSGTLA